MKDCDVFGTYFRRVQTIKNTIRVTPLHKLQQLNSEYDYIEIEEFKLKFITQHVLRTSS